MLKEKEMERIIALQDEQIHQFKQLIKRMEKQNEKCFETILKLEHKIRCYEKITHMSSLLEIL